MHKINMFEDKKTATELNSIMQNICNQIDEGLHLVRGDGFNEVERSLYCRKMGKVLGSEISDILLEIYKEHPDLIPPEFLLPGQNPQEWAKEQ